jgi:hypothetical protein
MASSALDPQTGEERLGAVLTVKRTLVQLGGKLHEEPTAKSKAGDRMVFLDADTAALLREHRKTQAKARLAAPPGAWEDDDLVFCRDDGRPWNPDHISMRFKRLAERASLPPVKLHEGGRHTGNSLMYDAEVRQDIVMRQVGHASTEISQRYTTRCGRRIWPLPGRSRRWSAGLGRTRPGGAERHDHARVFPGCSPRGVQPACSTRPFRGVLAGRCRWGGWGSNPRPADYETNDHHRGRHAAELLKRGTFWPVTPASGRAFAI